jgi:D-alanyl-lipoteichoic acid acyltransferase DltB (MBOAT superfamily)
MQGVGFKISPFLLDVVLPVGFPFIPSMVCLMSLIFYKRIKAEYNFVDYSLFVSYFPLLVAGPIERALTYCLKVKRTFDFEKKVEEFTSLFGVTKKSGHC